MLRNAVLTPANNPLREPVPRGSYTELYLDFIRRRFRVGGRLVEYDEAISLSAPSPKCVWNAPGHPVEIPAGQPAWDHDPVTGEPLGQRIESVGATNLAKNSFNVSLWLNGAGLTAGEYEGYPCVYETENNENHSVMLDAFATDGERYTRYIIAKPIGRRYVGVSVRGFAVLSPSGLNWDAFDTETEQWVYNNRGFSAEKLSYGFFKFRYTGEAASSADQRFGAWATDIVSSDNLFLGDPQKGLAVICGQYEAGDAATSPIETTGSAVTRAADVVNANTSFAEQYDPARGWLFIDYDCEGARQPGRYIMSARDSQAAASTERLVIYSSFVAVYSNGTQYTFPSSNLTGRHKVLFRWANGVITMFIDGAGTYSVTAEMPPGLDLLGFFHQPEYSPGRANGHLFNFQMGDTLSDADAIARTTL